ncbi:MAG: TetR/AcrR family transcriptional regulator [Dysosmobacter sp.]
MPLDVKAAVADALLELIRRKDADKITVKDLVEVCGISRQTFYYHFKDIVDVVEWAAQQGVQRLVRESLNAATPPGGPGRLRGFCRRIPAPWFSGC